ncbi:uncharacterized protein LOC111012078 [Momordica charantia]|uniref:Uncharacterized protein LOC111012078 n=1 Tax=Momordica charantia TaxID=3673 RepID=A0A6J1CKV1_MOMCH|nr:uncharacterized protein LOC111012078 [Momordica charantia]
MEVRSFKHFMIFKVLSQHRGKHIQKLTLDLPMNMMKIVCEFVDDSGALILPSLKILDIRCNIVSLSNGQFFVFFILLHLTFRQPAAISDSRSIKTYKQYLIISLIIVDFKSKSPTIYAPKLEHSKLCATFEIELTFPKVELLTPNLKSVNFTFRDDF